MVLEYLPSFNQSNLNNVNASQEYLNNSNLKIAVYNNNYTNSLEEESQHITAITVLKSILILAIIFAAIFGNILVITSVLKFKNLRIISNWFIVSLACADLIVALLVMPFSASQEIAGDWRFNSVVCDVFNANDVLFSTASMINICCISRDKYIYMSDSFNYRKRMTKIKATIMLACAWGFSAFISHIPIHTGIYTTERVRNASSVIEGICIFEVNLPYALISSTISFWIPATIMVISYILIMKIANKHEQSITKEMSDLYFSTDRRNSFEFKKRQYRAFKTLGKIMGCFLLCWLPFFVTYVVVNCCGSKCQPPPWFISLLFWIGYFNSALNPVIYGLSNTDFRDAFKTLLKCKQFGFKSVDSSFYAKTRQKCQLLEAQRRQQLIEARQMQQTIDTEISTILCSTDSVILCDH